MATPAERYAADARRRKAARLGFTEFAAGLPFRLDEFQVRACEAVAAGRGVLVAAPTGSGKTVVGEFAVDLALRSGRKAFYTTPIKALSNQKFRDLVARHGEESVGLLTGDTSIRGEAPIVVMTTEVLRNMMYAGSSTLDGLGCVVMDEVHYLADRFRGAVWEEIIIHLPSSVQIVSLSATVSNAEEFGAWLGEVRGATDVIVSEERPVPLWQHLLVGTRLYDLRTDRAGRVDARLREAIERQAPGVGGRSSRSARQGPAGRPRPFASRPAVVATLAQEGLLPAIVFVFSRAGCDAAVDQMRDAGVRLVSPEETAALRAHATARLADIAREDRAVLGIREFVDGLAGGYAAHHAGMLPLLREVVEELFAAGRLRVVFATETLALGINMPARSVVLERLVKFNGEAHVDVTPAEYTQLTGRAGRRGIDVDGHGVVQWRPGVDPEAVAALAARRTDPLRSSFTPTPNMAVNLVATLGRERARETLQSSFAQYQADRAVVGLAGQIRRNEEAMAGYAEAMHCSRGDFPAYAKLRRELADAEKRGAGMRAADRRAETALSVDRLRPGDVIHLDRGRQAGWVVVVSTAAGSRGLVVVTEDARLHTLRPDDLIGPAEPATRLGLPTGTSARAPKARKDLAARLRAAVAGREAPGRRVARPREGDVRIERLRRAVRSHPAHACPDREEHARWAERWWRLHRENTGLQRRIDARTNTVAVTFDAVCVLLSDLGYLSADGERVTADGERLRRIYTERDLLTAECLRTGTWAGLDPAGLAAAVSAVVHEPRGGEDLTPAGHVPGRGVAGAIDATTDLADTLRALEERHGLTPSPMPAPALAPLIHRWASGAGLAAALGDSEVAPGDFVRRCRQLIDVLDQLADVGDPRLRATAREAVRAVRRGVVAAASA